MENGAFAPWQILHFSQLSWRKVCLNLFKVKKVSHSDEDKYIQVFSIDYLHFYALKGYIIPILHKFSTEWKLRNNSVLKYK